MPRKAVYLAGSDGNLIETIGFADDLMLHGGIFNCGGVVAVGDAPGEKLNV